MAYELEIMSGLSALVATLFTFILGALMISKYLKYKERTILLMGLSLMFVGQPWWPYGIASILYLTTGDFLSVRLHVLIGHILQPIAMLLWMVVISELLWKKRQKLVIILTACFSTIYESVILYTIFIDPSRFVIEDSPFDYRFQSLFVLCQLSSLIVVIITGILFYLGSRKSPQPENRLKGLLFLISVLSYATGAILDSSLPLNLIVLVVVRILLLSSSIEVYMAFAMPKWVRKLFLKEE